MSWITGLSFFAERLNRLFDALEGARRSQQIVDAEPRHRVLGADRFETGDGEIDALGVTFANEIGQDLRRGKVDLDNTRRLQHE